MASSKVLPRQKSFLEPVVNPFIHRVNLTFSQKLQVAFMSVTIAPLRVVLICITFFTTWLMGYIFTLGMDENSKKPLSPARAFFCQLLSYLGRAVLFCTGFHRFQIRGTRAKNSEASVVVVAPHTSMFDVCVWFANRPLACSISRSENSQIPFIGTLVKAVQPVLVSRKDPDSRKSTIEQMIQRAESPELWPQMFLFPEGTCTNGKALISFKAGAFIPGVPVQPVAMRYLNDFNSFTWTMNGPNAYELMWLTLCQFSIKTELIYLPIYYPSEAEKNSPKLYANNVRNLLADTLGVSCTDHTFEDCRLMRHAADLNLPMEIGLVEFTKISRKLGMDIDDCKDRLSEFAKIAHDREDGLVTIEDFSNFLKIPISPVLQEMFNLYDRNSSGVIDFREYVLGLSLVSQPAVTEDTIQLAFNVFDKNCDKHISKEEFIHVLKATIGNEFNGDVIFSQMEKENADKVTYDEFVAFVNKRPEYAKVFLYYKNMKQDDVSQLVQTRIERQNSISMSSSPGSSEDGVTQRKGARKSHDEDETE